MSWLFSQVLVVEYLGENFSDDEQSVPLNGNHIQQAYLQPDRMTKFSRVSRFGMTFKPLTESRGEELLTLYLAGFHAKTLVQQEKAQELTENEAECGEKWQGSFTKYDQSSCSWKTHQCSLLGDLDEFSETWPQWGLMRDGECWEQQTLEQTIKGTESGLSGKMWLTPRASDTNKGEQNKTFLKRMGDRTDVCAQSLAAQVNNPKTWPTPRSCSAMAATLTEKGDRFPNLETVVARMDKTTVGGKLNPMWVEWLMGWTLGWTDLKPLVMDKCHCVQQQRGES
jgi:hypothetical protein